MARFICVIFAFVLATCGSVYRESDVSQAEIDIQEQIWAESQSDDYTLVYTEQCFCLEAGEVTVVVRDGQINQAFRTNPPNSQNQTAVTNPRTVNALFDLVRRAQAEAFRLSVRFDKSYGYPESISIDWIRNAADDELGITVVRLTRQ